jgi:uncharacterized protein (TIGR03083 family)
MDVTPQDLVDLAFDAAETDGLAVPPALRARALGAAVAAAPPRMHPAWSADGLSSLSTFLRTASELGDLLDGLDDGEWERPTRVADLTVCRLLQHLVGVERYLLGQLGRRPARTIERRADHLPVALADALDLDGASGARVARAWWLEAMALVATVGELGPDHPVAYYDLAGSLRGLLVVRTFELWTHDEDVRAATGRPPNDLDEGRLGLMAGALLGVLPIGMALAGTARPGRTARLEVELPRDRITVDLGLAPDEPAGPPDVTIRTDALHLCRLAANRLRIDELVVDVEGDRSLVEPVLVGAGAFALD